MDIRWLRVVRGCPYILEFKDTLNEDVSQDALYTDCRKITLAKKINMMDLLPVEANARLQATSSRVDEDDNILCCD